MNLYRTIHTIRYRDAKGRHEVTAGELVLLTSEVSADLLSAGAIKRASGDEEVLFRHANPHLFAQDVAMAAPQPESDEVVEDEDDQDEDDQDDETVEDEDDSGEGEGEGAELDGLAPKHVGGGRYRVVNASDEVVSGDEVFADKDAAIAWITAASEAAAQDANPVPVENLLG